MRVPMEIGTCKHCGKEYVVQAESRNEADRDATEMCDCPKATRHRKFEKARDALDVLEMELKTDSSAMVVIAKMRDDLTKLEKVAI